MSRRSTMAPRYVPFGQRFGHEVGTGYQHSSRFDVPLEPTPEPRTDWFHTILWVAMIAATLAVAAYAFLPAASPVSQGPDAQQPVALEARAGGKVSS